MEVALFGGPWHLRTMSVPDAAQTLVLEDGGEIRQYGKGELFTDCRDSPRSVYHRHYFRHSCSVQDMVLYSCFVIERHCPEHSGAMQIAAKLGRYLACYVDGWLMLRDTSVAIFMMCDDIIGGTTLRASAKELEQSFGQFDGAMIEIYWKNKVRRVARGMRPKITH